MLHELHSHLYGCLVADDLAWLAARKPPRWPIFMESYRAAYGREPDIEGLFTPAGRTRLEEYFYFTAPGDFRKFQAGFDLIIAVAHTDPEELAAVAQRVGEREVADHAEYRMLFSPRESSTSFREKTIACAEGLADASRRTGKTLRLAVSLPREPRACEARYADTLACLDASAKVRETIVAIDFCHVEEGSPPRDKRDFFAAVSAENQRYPERALAVLYHVGESFQDKSVESAARWVVESAESGAHRLGHCVALGAPAEFFRDSTRYEIAAERRDQLQFELDHSAELGAFGYAVDADACARELRDLRDADDRAPVAAHYDAGRLERLRVFQDWCMEQVRASGAIVESCPTSNLRIAGLGAAEHHPLPRFLRAGLAVTLGADDPGILQTNLRAEYELAASWPGVSEADVERMQATAARATSEQISGRRSG